MPSFTCQSMSRDGERPPSGLALRPRPGRLLLNELFVSSECMELLFPGSRVQALVEHLLYNVGTLSLTQSHW